ncbi:MAG TPA: ATP synthase subunit I [Smithellaceae bacterium]|nr:ATP synthase subunit I [Smithellaceae bacterium]
MNANTIFILALMFLAGLALGAFYFISLWQTLKKLPQTQNRASLLMISFVLRVAVVLTALFFLMDGRWERAAAAMIGFIVMRKILTYRLGPQKMAEAALK